MSFFRTGKGWAVIAIAVLIGLTRYVMQQEMIMAPMTPAAILIVAVGIGLFVWWLGVLYDHHREGLRS